MFWAHVFRSKAASCASLQVAPDESQVAAVASEPQPESIVFPVIRQLAGASVVTAQYPRPECMADARLVACIATIDRLPDTWLLETARACILASPSSPIATT